ncbi:MAG: hypothetical protein K6G88_12335 [Lachnospiraceae bacterium]|nr:hypothetical protein [Lachnospiraceae bacterium]
MQNKIMQNKIVPVTVAALILLVPVLIIVLPKKDFSENENRMLQKVPVVTLKNIKEGVFSDEVEKYVSDHFPLRDELVSLKCSVQKIAGIKEFNNVFLGKGRLIQHIEEPQTGVFEDRINRLCDNLEGTGTELNLMLIPTNATVYSSQLPKNAPDIVNEQAIIHEIYDNTNCNGIDVVKELLNEKDNHNLYYNLDHHWNYYGAYAGYRQYCKQTGIEPKDIEDFERKTLAKDFRGTLYSKVLIKSMKPDVIEAVEFPESGIKVEYVDKKKETNDYYDYSFLKKKDKYSVFGGGNQALQIVENQESESEDELVIVKDSFANCFVPFLVYHYRKIHIIDPRYYMPHISDYVKKNENVKDVLVLYNIDSLNNNSGIVKIK